jgi:DNA ligase-1
VGTGLSDKQRENPPQLGSTITFRYQELSDGGVPRFPSYVGLRRDATASQQLVASAPQQKQTAKTTVVIASAAPATKKRMFEFSDGKSNKFWEVWQSGADMTTRWGRIGSAGQSKTKTFADAAAASRQIEKLIQEKTEEGYEEA